jgi:ABC-2 type transport system ATP-binding protein
LSEIDRQLSLVPGPPSDPTLDDLLRFRSVAAEIAGVPILRDVSLRVRRGEIVALLGPNGAGKTTTLSVALGLIAPSSGTVRILGHDPTDRGEQVRALIGTVPERGGFYDWMTAPAYLGFFARLHGVERDSGDIAERLQQVGLAARRGQHIATFSHGMRQRLALARALLADPLLLLLDEPTGGLDPRGRREVHELLRRLAGDGLGIVLSTHLLDDVERLCDRVAVISRGATVAEGHVRELTAANDAPARRTVERYRLRVDGIGEVSRLPAGISVIDREGDWCTVEIAVPEAPEAVWRELMFLGWRVREIHWIGSGGSALERLYLRLTTANDDQEKAA